MVAVLEQLGVPPRMVRSLVDGRRAQFRTAYGVTVQFEPGRGLAQGCPLACLLCVVALDALNRAMEATCRGARIGGAAGRRVALGAAQWPSAT